MFSMCHNGAVGFCILCNSLQWWTVLSTWVHTDFAHSRCLINIWDDTSWILLSEVRCDTATNLNWSQLTKERSKLCGGCESVSKSLCLVLFKLNGPVLKFVSKWKQILFQKVLSSTHSIGLRMRKMWIWTLNLSLASWTLKHIMSPLQYCHFKKKIANNITHFTLFWQFIVETPTEGNDRARHR